MFGRYYLINLNYTAKGGEKMKRINHGSPYPVWLLGIFLTLYLMDRIKKTVVGIVYIVYYVFIQPISQLLFWFDPITLIERSVFKDKNIKIGRGG